MESLAAMCSRIGGRYECLDEALGLGRRRRRDDFPRRKHYAVLTLRLDQPTLELLLVQLRVQAAVVEELLVRALFDEAATIHHEDHIGGEDRGETVRDRDRGPAPHQRPKGPLDQPVPG